jgi:uncharacterized protein (TIGR02001 family)
MGLLLTAALLGVRAARADVPTGWEGVSSGGGITLTSDYIYRGVSESDGHGAVQGDLHLATSGGTFLGVWASSRDSDLEPGAAAVTEIYLGHRFSLSGSWDLTASARSHYYLDSSGYEPSNDYQEVSAALSYLDRWSFSLTAIPNAVRYWVFTRLSRSPAWVADASGQWLLGEHFFITGGAGYYYSTGTGPGIERATGYAYGNLGVAYEVRNWRLDVGYFAAQDAARRSFPYPTASQHVAATLAWRF